MFLKTFYASAAITLALAIPTLAAPVNWVLTDVTFGDGASATGGFTYDAATGTYSNIAISRSAGTLPGAFTGATHEAWTFTQETPAPNFTSSDSVAIFTGGAADLTGQLFFQMVFSTALDDLGQTTALSFGTGTGRCATANCNQVQSNQAVLAQGFVTAAPVPLPAGGALLLAGLALLARLRRQQG